MRGRALALAIVLALLPAAGWLQVATLGLGPVNAADADGKLFVAHADGRVRAWAPDGTLAGELRGHTGGVMDVAVTGSVVLTASKDGTVGVWDATSLALVRTLPCHRGWTMSVTGDERYVYAGTAGFTLHVFDRERDYAPVSEIEPGGGAVLAMAASNQTLYSGHEDGSVRVWTTGERLTRGSVIRAHGSWVLDIVVGPDRLFTSSRDGRVRAWSLPGHERAWELTGPHMSVRGITAWRDDILVARNNGTVARVRGSDGRALATWELEDCSPREVTVINGRAMVPCGDGTVRAWDLDGGEMPALSFPPDAPCHLGRVLSVLATGPIVFTGGKDGTLAAWDSGTLRPVACINRTSAVNDLAYWEGMVLAGQSDGAVHLLDRSTLGPQGTLAGHTNPVNAVHVRGDRAYTASDDGTVRVWDLPGERSLAVLTGHTGPVADVYADDQYVYSASDDKTARVWDATTHAEVSVLDGRGKGVRAVVADELYVYTAGDDRSVHLWERGNWTHVRRLAGHGDWVLALARDGRYLYSGGKDRDVRVWNPGDWEAGPVTLSGTGSWVTSLSPQGHLLFAASADGTTRAWADPVRMPKASPHPTAAATVTPAPPPTATPRRRHPPLGRGTAFPVLMAAIVFALVAGWASRRR